MALVTLFFLATEVAINGLGRLTDANETITKIDSNTISHSYVFAYDMRSQLTDANISNINGGNWVAHYSYHDNGDMVSRTVQANQTDFTYSGNQMITAGGDNLSYDKNGNLKLKDMATDTNLTYNWDNKLRCAKSGSSVLLALKYDPLGNRIYKETTNGAVKRKYIVDIVGDLPVILMEINPTSSSIIKTYIYANSQIIALHNGGYTASRYFYLHDRLGSVREVIDTSGIVKAYLTYNPFGVTLEGSTGVTLNMWAPFRFAGQYYDTEIGQYYLRARQYDPYISRFTSRDSADGKFEEPLTLHKYLYCTNNPINMIDPLGLDAYLFFTPEGKDNWLLRDYGHISVGVDDVRRGHEGEVVIRSADNKGLYPIDDSGKSLENAVDNYTATSSGTASGIFVTFKNKPSSKYSGSTSDYLIWLYLTLGHEPSGVRPFYPYCSPYSKAALAYGGYDMGIGAGITPKTLMAAAIGKSIFGKDENIEVNYQARQWYFSEVDWLNDEQGW